MWGSVPPFTDWVLVSTTEWSYGAEARFKSKVEHLLKAVVVLKQRGLIGEWLNLTFVQRWL